MSDKLRVNRKQNIALVVGLLLAAGTMIVLCTWMVGVSSKTINRETTRYLGEVSQQLSREIGTEMARDLDALEVISDNLLLLADAPALREQYMENAVSYYNFSWVGLVNREGQQVLGSKPYWNVHQLPAVVERALAGETGVSETLMNGAGSTPGIIYAAPYMEDDKVVGAVLGWNTLDGMQEVLNGDTFGGSGFFHIIDHNGDFIVRSRNPNASIVADNFLDALRNRATVDVGGTAESFIADINSGQNGHLIFTLDGKIEETMDYISLNDEGWYLLSIVPTSVYADDIQQFVRFSMVINIVIFVLFAVLLLFIWRLNNKKNNEIAGIAYIDPVTGGFTAPRFELEVRKKLSGGEPFAFLSMDVRRFKLINDAYGSEDGNLVLRYIHDGIKAHLQEGEYVSRISADTFNVVLVTVCEPEIRQWVEGVGETINAFNRDRAVPYFLRLDCGVYSNHGGAEEIITLRDRANTARKSCKLKEESVQQCHSGCAFYDDIDRLQLLREKEIENCMERALENREFVVYLQPKVGLEDNRIIGAEALVRWERPGDRLWMPDEFIPLFERNGFIVQLDLFVFAETCRLLRKWLEEGREPLAVSVNLSRVHLNIPHFLRQFQAIQEHYQVPPELLEIELTETMVFENLEQLKRIIEEIHQCGFRCSLDDFGSGYSSLNVLKDVRVDALKLDRVFFDKENDDRGNDVIASVIAMARKLGMQTIAEGVESMDQVEFLRGVRCDMVQGYVFSKPVPVCTFEKMLAEER